MRHLRWRAVAALAGVLLLVLGVSGTSGARSSSERSTRAPSIKAFPLWEFLPTRAYATLIDRTRDELRVAVYVFRSERRGADGICLQMVMASKRGNAYDVTNASPNCKVLAANDDFVAFAASLDRLDESVFGVVSRLGPVSSYGFELDGTNNRLVTARKLSMIKAKKANVPRLSYAVIWPAQSCLEQIRALAADGAEIFSSYPADCSG